MTKLGVGFLVAVVLTGCATARSGGTSSTLPPKELGVASILKFEDVPVPAGFRMVQDQSFSFQNDLTRVGILRYAGRANSQRVIQFYKEQMPLYNWNFVNLLEYEKSLLNFEKADQLCTVTVESGLTRTNLVIAVAPKGGTFRGSHEAKVQENRKRLDKE